MTWLLIKDAPLNEVGHVWCPEFGDRTDALGSVYAYDAHEDDGRGVSSTAKGYHFTHWHPLPPPPLQNAPTPTDGPKGQDGQHNMPNPKGQSL